MERGVGRGVGLFFLASVVATSVALVAAPVAARAAKPFTLDGGARASFPDLAVDSRGTAHIAWNVIRNITVGDQVVYCEVPRGKRSCARKRTFDLPLDEV